MSADFRVLHVDDESGFTDLTVEYLERENDRFQIETATSAPEGLDILDEHQIDCIVSDHDMPIMNGIEFLERVRDEYPDLPFILFTGKGTEKVASQAISAGVTDYLQKEGGADQFTVLANRIENAVAKYQAERELDETRRQYEKITEQNLTGSYLIQGGEFVYVNPTLADIHGYDRETLIGMSPLELVAPEERTRVEENLGRRLDGDVEEVHYETVGLTKDGDRIDIELHGSRVTYGGDPAVIGTELDISERKEREQELRKYKRRFEAIFNNPITFMAILEPDGTVLSVNENALSFAGTTQESVHGEQFSDTPWWSHSESVQRKLQSQIEEASHGELVRFETDHYSQDGERVSIEGIIHPIRNTEGDVIELVAAGHEIT